MDSDRTTQALLYAIVFLAVVFGIFLGVSYLTLEWNAPIPEQVPTALAFLLAFPLPAFRHLFPPPAGCVSCTPTLPAIFATIIAAVVAHASWIYAVLSWRERRKHRKSCD